LPLHRIPDSGTPGTLAAKRLRVFAAKRLRNLRREAAPESSSRSGSGVFVAKRLRNLRREAAPESSPRSGSAPAPENQRFRYRSWCRTDVPCRGPTDRNGTGPRRGARASCRAAAPGLLARCASGASCRDAAPELLPHRGGFASQPDALAEGTACFPRPKGGGPRLDSGTPTGLPDSGARFAAGAPDPLHGRSPRYRVAFRQSSACRPSARGHGSAP
jgi:hypothetical protein